MATSASPAGADDDARLAAHGAALADAIEAALPGWVVERVSATADAWQPGLAAQLRPAAVEAGDRARDEVVPRIRALLAQDPDEQAGTPLALVRDAVAHPTDVLADAGVGEVVRDEFAAAAFPEDRYGLAPASLGELSAAAREAGLTWGAAKAHVILARRRAEGLR